MHLDVILLPQRVLKCLRIPDGVEHHVNVLLSSALIALLFLTGWAMRLAEMVPHWCIFQKVLGVPCPGCGMTRALHCMAAGELAASVRMHPCGALLVAALVTQTIVRFALIRGWISGGAAHQWIKHIGNSFVAALMGWWVWRLTIS